MENKSSIKLATDRCYIAGEGAAVLQFAAAMPSTASLDVGRLKTVTPPGAKGSVEIMSWGTGNNLPFYREELITGNNIVPALIERKRNVLCGQGWYAYQQKFIDDGSGQMRRDMDEVPMPPEAEAFFKKFKKTGRTIIGELLKHGLATPEFIRAKVGTKGILSVKCPQTKYVRASKQAVNGDISSYWWSNYWVSSKGLKNEDKVMREMPVFDEMAATKQPRFVLPLMDDLFNDGYYPIPAYWGGRHWITLSNIIPLFHEANLAHGSSPRFHIVIPHDFFFDYEKMNGAATEEERATLLTEFQARETAFVDDLNEVLTGIGNTGRTVVTKSELVEYVGGKYDKRILIEEIKFDFRDDALLQLYAASNVANVSAQALHPTLASIETAGKGIGSGTEIRNAFLLYLIIAAPVYRDMLQEVIELVKRENGWPTEIHYAIRDAEMTTLAENPAGVQPAETKIGA